MTVEIEIVDQGRAGEFHQIDGLVGLVAEPGDILHVLARLDPPVFDAIEKKHQLLRKTPRLRPVKTFTHFLTLMVNRSLTY
ncbi:hypothetical protein D3C72_2425030 [compost metagenome]